MSSISLRSSMFLSSVYPTSTSIFFSSSSSLYSPDSLLSDWARSSSMCWLCLGTGCGEGCCEGCGEGCGGCCWFGYSSSNSLSKSKRLIWLTRTYSSLLAWCSYSGRSVLRFLPLGFAFLTSFFFVTLITFSPSYLTTSRMWSMTVSPSPASSFSASLSYSENFYVASC